MYYVSEIFKSIQGEGHYTGVPTIWIRSFGCNLECNGFGQVDPTDPDTYELPYQTLDLSTISKVEDLPVFSKGCDSSYSWSKKYKHLMKKMSVSDIVSAVEDLLPGYGWNTNEGGTDFHLAFTGGEPLMKKNQKMILQVMKAFGFGAPRFVTFETNGTQPLTPELADYMKETSKVLFNNSNNPVRGSIEYFFSVSPKLFSVAGEHASKAIKPEVLNQYISLSSAGQLKFVSDGSNRSFDEIKKVCDELDPFSVYSRWIMPVGATLEEQEANAGDIAMDAVERGYNVSARVHCYLFGNQIGT